MERSHLWVRLAIFVLPLGLLVIFGPQAATAAAICAACTFGSYATVWGLLKFQPDAVRRGQIGLRLFDVLLLFVGISQVQIVLLRQTGSVTDVYDMLYVLTVISSVANNGLRGGLILTLASGAAILLDRLLLLQLGLLPDLSPGRIGVLLLIYLFMFAVTSSTVFYLMQVSAMLAARRERALSAVIAADNVKLEQANETLKARRRLTADIAHDLRSPLTTISGYSEAISSGALPATPERLGAINRQVERLDHMIGDLRLLSLADIGALPLTMGTVELPDLLGRTVENFTLSAQEHQIALTYDAEPNLPTIEGDLQRLEQVLGNLVSNAIRHTPSAGSVHLTASRDGDAVQLTVQDTGEGIAADELPHVFDRLYRAGPQEKRDSAGSGLGLAIVQALVTAHQGDIAVTSTLGQGTTFTIRLPA